MKVSYSSTLPAELMKMLEFYADKMDMPKNQLIEASIRHYLTRLKRAEYIRSFQRVGEDEEQVQLAEEGMEEFLELVDQYSA